VHVSPRQVLSQFLPVQLLVDITNQFEQRQTKFVVGSLGIQFPNMFLPFAVFNNKRDTLPPYEIKLSHNVHIAFPGTSTFWINSDNLNFLERVTKFSFSSFTFAFAMSISPSSHPKQIYSLCRRHLSERAHHLLLTILYKTWRFKRKEITSMFSQTSADAINMKQRIWLVRRRYLNKMRVLIGCFSIQVLVLIYIIY